HKLWRTNLKMKHIIIISYIINRNTKGCITDSYFTMEKKLGIPHEAVKTLCAKLTKLGLLKTYKWYDEGAQQFRSRKWVVFDELSKLEVSTKKKYVPTTQDAFYTDMEFIHKSLSPNKTESEVKAWFIAFYMYANYRTPLVEGRCHSNRYLVLNERVMLGTMNFFGITKTEFKKCIKYIIENDLILNQHGFQYEFNTALTGFQNMML
ncbi:MAG: hypothetical protein ACRC5T_12140, partial [Cetobacterium sp.]